MQTNQFLHLGTLGNVFGWGMDFVQFRKDHPHAGVATAAGYAALQAYLWTSLAPLMWTKTGFEMAAMLGTALPTWMTTKRAIQSRFYHANFGGNVMDSQMAATLRQRSVAAAATARQNLETILGREAERLYQTGMAW